MNAALETDVSVVAPPAESGVNSAMSVTVESDADKISILTILLLLSPSSVVYRVIEPSLFVTRVSP